MSKDYERFARELAAGYAEAGDAIARGLGRRKPPRVRKPAAAAPSLDRDLLFFRYADLVAHGFIRNRKTLNRWIEAGLFPAPVKLGPAHGPNAWRARDIDEWVKGRTR